MRGATRLVLGLALGIALGLAAASGVGCAAPSGLAFSEPERPPAFRTWDWLPDAATTVDAPPGDARALDGQLAQLVEQALRARGFERSPGSADVRVGALLRVRRNDVAVYRTGAVETLFSHHDSPSFEVQARQTEIHPYEQGRLVIFLTDGRGERVLWRGALGGQFRDALSPHLEELVTSLLDRFPPPASAALPAPAP